MRALRGGIPRAFDDSRRSIARAYRAYCEAVLATWGPFPAAAAGTLREAGRAHVELQRLADDLEGARARKRPRDAARIRRDIFKFREQHARLELKLREFTQNPNRHGGPADKLGDIARAVQEANR